MRWTQEQLDAIREAVVDMALSDQDHAQVRQHANRVTFWLENGGDLS